VLHEQSTRHTLAHREPGKIILPVIIQIITEQSIFHPLFLTQNMQEEDTALTYHSRLNIEINAANRKVAEM